MIKADALWQRWALPNQLIVQRGERFYLLFLCKSGKTVEEKDLRPCLGPDPRKCNDSTKFDPTTSRLVYGVETEQEIKV